MSVMAVGDSAHRMAQDLNGRFRHVLIVVGRARLSDVIEHPRGLLTIFNIVHSEARGNGYSWCFIRSYGCQIVENYRWPLRIGPLWPRFSASSLVAVRNWNVATDCAASCD